MPKARNLVVPKARNLVPRRVGVPKARNLVVPKAYEHHDNAPSKAAARQAAAKRAAMRG